MSAGKFFNQILNILGKNNDAAIAVVAVASAKGIFRPMFTMMDKEQDHETKKYTAMREGLTEAIAIPCYIGVSLLAKAIAPMMYEGEEAIKKASKTLSFVGVCTAALLVIPAVCSIMITPIMDFLKEPTKNNFKNIILHPKNYNKMNVMEQPNAKPIAVINTNANNKLKSTYTPFNQISYNSNLRIGGN